MNMVLKDGKKRVLTLSYDDGVVQDIRLMEILNHYGLKATFNINSGLYLSEDAERESFYGKLKRSEGVKLYKESGHEVALHGFNHPGFHELDETEMIREVIEDRKDIEATYGTIARGLAYPGATYNDKVIKVLEKCDIAYARTADSLVYQGNAGHWFSFPENWLTWHPTCHHNYPKLMEVAEAFFTKNDFTWMFYLWGHSYEFDNRDNWDVIEKFAEFMGGRDDVWYATNIEIYDYVKAYESLRTNYEKTRVYNPSGQIVWFREKERDYCVKPGETVEI